MGSTFAEKFEEALAEKRRTENPDYGIRTVARVLSDGDKEKVEVIRRRLHKYRPKRPGGAAITPTEPTRHEIEKAMGLEQDALKPEVDENAAAAQAFMDDLMPFAQVFERMAERAFAKAQEKIA